MSVSASSVQNRFNSTNGLDPIFRTNDGSNCDHNIDTSTVAGRASAYSLLRTRGLIRVALSVPAGAEFTVESVSNPYGCNEKSTLSVYRRPLPSANLRFLSTVMWDGRESSAQNGTTPIDSSNYPGSLIANLRHQALDATLGHAQGAVALTDAQQQAIVDFEMGLYSGQANINAAGNLDNQANGGPEKLSGQPFFIGINDPVGLNPSGIPFQPNIFNTFDGWMNERNPQRASIARGQVLFNSKPITIARVGGLNGTFVPDGFTGTCGTCHDSPNAGNHSVSAPLNIGLADTVPAALDASYLPVITLRNNSSNEIVATTDPGRALITGKWADIGRFKGPVLRGLATRAPYFHNGSAATLLDVINFYDARFGIGFTAAEKADLVAFLNAL
jgi:hypothetical protein